MMTEKEYGVKVSKSAKKIGDAPIALQIAIVVLVDKTLPSGKKVQRIESITRHVRLTGTKYLDKQGKLWGSYTKDGDLKITSPYELLDEKAVA